MNLFLFFKVILKVILLRTRASQVRILSEVQILAGCKQLVAGQAQEIVQRCDVTKIILV